MRQVTWAGVIGLALLVVSGPGAQAARRGGEGQYRAVESRIFDAVKYEGSTRTLTLVFDSGAAYAYVDVPRAVYDDFVRIVNKGEYFNRHIKRAYLGRRLESYPASWCARD
jgi:hypothetical protein